MFIYRLLLNKQYEQ